MLLGRGSGGARLATTIRRSLILCTTVAVSSLVRSSSSKMTEVPPAAPASTASYVPGTASIAYVTAPNADVAKTLARGLLEQHLAACINILPGITSIYRWDGAIQEDTEVLMMIKTETRRVDELSQYVRKNHPYDVAEVISVPIENGNPPYMDFLVRSMKKED